jgi:hypothetical protein
MEGLFLGLGGEPIIGFFELFVGGLGLVKLKLKFSCLCFEV